MRKLTQKGSVLIFVTLGFALLGVFVGFAADFGRAYLTRARLSRLVDGASLAAAKVLKGQPGFESDATRAACDSMLMNGAQVLMTGAGNCDASGNSSLNVKVEFVTKAAPGGPPIQFVEVTGTETVPTPFLSLLSFMAPGNFSKLDVSVAAQAGPERPVDLVLVLDRSASMNSSDGSGATKISALRTTVNEFLSNNFSADDRLGMVSFASRGCGNSSGQDSTTSGNCTPDIDIDFATDAHLSTLKRSVSRLCGGGSNCQGGTNTMEALRTARTPIAQAFADATRETSRKVMLLVTDGQPTFMRRTSKDHCERNPKTGELLPPPGDTGGSTAGCKHGLPSGTSGSDDFIYRQSLANGGASGLEKIPPSGGAPQLYQDVIGCTRSLVGCVANGAMFEANLVRNCGFGNSGCSPGGSHDVLVFAIAIGKTEPNRPQNSLDANAKCLLARIANAEVILNAGSGATESITTVCNSTFTTRDNDTHADLVQAWPCGGGPCIDGTQQKGKVYTVDVNGSITEQLRLIFNEVAALLKLRLTI